MSLAFFFFPILDNKVKGKDYCKDCKSTHKDVKTFHFKTPYSLSFGVIKYAKRVNAVHNKSMPEPNKIESLSVTIEPIIPAVNTYLAASAKILATTFLLSLFTISLYHIKEAI